MTHLKRPIRSVGVGGLPTVVITPREKRALKASNKLYQIIGEALDDNLITGLQFRLAKAALVLIENLIIPRFSFNSIDDAIEEVKTSADIYDAFEEPMLGENNGYYKK